MNYNMFDPIRILLEEIICNNITFSLSDYNKNKEYYNSVGINSFNHIEPTVAFKKIWDIVFLSDYLHGYFRWDQCFIQINHGVAGKKCHHRNLKGDLYSYDYRFHPTMPFYKYVFFYNSGDLKKARNLNILANNIAGRVAGMPILDKFIQNNNNYSISSLKIKNIPIEYQKKKIIMFAPTWGENSSYQMMGARILKVLSEKDAFIIIKPHPLCITENIPGNNMNLEDFCKNLFKKGNYGIYTKSPYDLMLISDMLIADFSSIALEYTILRKPIWLYLNKFTEDNVADIEQLNMLKNASKCYSDTELDYTHSLDYYKIDYKQIYAMNKISDRYFENIGRATEIIVNDLINLSVVKIK